MHECDPIAWFCWLKEHAVLDVALLAATIALAVYTARLFASTREMAEKTAALVKSTVDANALADRHHQESITPIVALNACLTAEYGALDPPTQKPAWKFFLRGTVANTGLGPALNIRVEIDASDCVPQVFRMKSLAANSSEPIVGERGGAGAAYVWYRVPFNENEDRRARCVPYTSRVYYENLFQTPGKTVQETHSGDELDLRLVEQLIPGARNRVFED